MPPRQKNRAAPRINRGASRSDFAVCKTVQVLYIVGTRFRQGVVLALRKAGGCRPEVS